MNKALIGCVVAVVSAMAFAKLPPLSDDAKGKAEEAKAKAAYTAKVDAYLLCKSQDKVAAQVHKTQKPPKPQAAKPVDTPPCTDPGKFVYTPAEAAPAAAVTASSAASVPIPVSSAASIKAAVPASAAQKP